MLYTYRICIFVIPNFPIVRWRKRYVEIKWSIYNVMMAFVINSLLDSNITEQFAIRSNDKSIHDDLLFIICVSWPNIWVYPEVVVNISIFCISLLSLLLGHNFENLALKSPTRIEHVGCWLLIPESKSMRFS